MKIFNAVLATALAQTKYCQPGRAVGIDQDGNPDASNTENCYVTKSAAQVTGCNDDDGNVQMSVKVLKDLFPIDWNPATHGFSENNGYYERVYQVNELAEKTDDTSGDFVLQAGVPFDGTSVNVAGTQLFTKVEGALSFRCRYPLGERTVSDDFTITGQDIEIERENTGTLTYRISFDSDDVSIGDWNGFKVSPANPSLGLYAQVKQCTISNNDKSANMVVFGKDNNYCRNSIINFEVVSGHGGQSHQNFRYKAFKWSTSVDDPDAENQHLSCLIDIQRNAFSAVATPACASQYN